jgi:multiple sugar transport system permease protein
MGKKLQLTIGAKKISIGLILSYLILLFITLIMNYPFLWMVSTALKARSEVFIVPPTLIPKKIVWTNFAGAWKLANWSRYFTNTVITAVIPTLGQMFFGSLAAFAFTRKFKGQKLLFLMVLGTMMIPSQATLVPNYVILKQLKWVNTYAGLTVPFVTSAFAIFLLRQYFLSVPKDYEDAATIDGSGPFFYLFRILMPLSSSALITVGLFAFNDRWNDFIWSLTMTTKDYMRTLQVGMRAFQSEASTEWTYMMAAATFVSMPIIILFLFVQKQFIEGVMMSGVKG